MSVAREEDDLRTNCEPTLLFEAPLAGSSRGFDCLFCSAADAVGRSVAGQSLTRRKKSAAKHPNSHELLSSLSLSSQHCSLVQKSIICRSFFHEHNHHFPILRYRPTSTASPGPSRRILSSTATLMTASHDASPLASTTVWPTRNCCFCWANPCRGNFGVPLEFTHHSLRLRCSSTMPSV